MKSLRLYHKTMIAQHLVIIGAIVFACWGGYVVGTHVIKALDGINTATADIHDSFDVINRPRTGTIAGLNQVIFGTDALMKHTNKILDHEEKQLSTLDTQEKTLFDDLHTLAIKATGEIGTLDTTTTTLNTLLSSLNDSAKKAPELVGNLNKISVDLDAKINDPAVKKLMDSLSETSVQVQGITTNTNKVTTHLEQVIDNPKPMSLKEKIGATFNILWKIGMLAK